MRRFETAIEKLGILRKVEVPEEISEALGPGRRVPVEGTVNGYPFRTHVVAGSEGCYRLFLDEDMRLGAAVDAGDFVVIELARDEAPQTYRMPLELDRAIGKKQHLRDAFDALPPGLLEHLVTWIASAKKPETRAAYVARALQMLEKRAQGRLGRD